MVMNTSTATVDICVVMLYKQKIEMCHRSAIAMNAIDWLSPDVHLPRSTHRRISLCPPIKTRQQYLFLTTNFLIECPS